MYEVTHCVYYRKQEKDGTFTNKDSQNLTQAFYTSKNKAIDRARSLAGTIKPYNVQLSYDLHMRGQTKHYEDHVVLIAEYREHKGKLCFEAIYCLLETDKGQILPMTRIADINFFNSI